MSSVLVTPSLLYDIADSIREMNDTSATYTLAQMPSAIEAIPSYSLIYSDTTSISSSSTSWATADTIALGSSAYVANYILYIQVRLAAGTTASHYMGGDTFYFNFRAANAQTSNITTGPHITWYTNSSSLYTGYVTTASSNYGLIPYTFTSAGNLTWRTRYSSTYSPGFNTTATYTRKIYLLGWAPDAQPWSS